jgi:hypothetical protein
MDASTTYILQRVLADVDFLRQQNDIQGQYECRSCTGTLVNMLI